MLVAFADVKDSASLTPEKIRHLGEALACYRFYQMEGALDEHPEIAKFISKQEYTGFLRREYLRHHSHSPPLTQARLYFDPRTLLEISFTKTDIIALFEF